MNTLISRCALVVKGLMRQATNKLAACMLVTTNARAMCKPANKHISHQQFGLVLVLWQNSVPLLPQMIKSSGLAEMQTHCNCAVTRTS